MLTGTSPDVVSRALETADPLPGTGGFAGRIEEGLVRDVLGRYPLFFDPSDPAHWSHHPGELDQAERLPAGCLHADGETTEVWSLPRPELLSEEAAIEELREKLGQALSAVDRSDLAVAFSGGVDSALLAAALEVPLYTVGFPESHDIEAARTGATLLDTEVHVLELDHDTVEAAIPAVVQATGRTNAMDVQIALPLYLLAQHCNEQGFERLALGQGADELFGGYEKVARAPEDHRVAADTIEGARREVVTTLPNQLERDWLTVTAGGLDPVLPLVHDGVVETALALPGSSLVTSDGNRKWAFRLAAREWLPDELAFRDKKALQYGSLVARELDRLARQAGFKRRMDDHVSRYVESVISPSSGR